MIIPFSRDNLRTILTVINKEKGTHTALFSRALLSIARQIHAFSCMQGKTENSLSILFLPLSSNQEHGIVSSFLTYVQKCWCFLTEMCGVRSIATTITTLLPSERGQDVMPLAGEVLFEAESSFMYIVTN